MVSTMPFALFALSRGRGAAANRNTSTVSYVKTALCADGSRDQHMKMRRSHCEGTCDPRQPEEKW